MPQQFEFLDVVEVISDKPKFRTIRGKKGIISGISQSEEDPTIFAYAVYLPFLKTTWFIWENELKFTGKKANPKEIETDASISVDSQGNLLDDDL